MLSGVILIGRGLDQKKETSLRALGIKKCEKEIGMKKHIYEEYVWKIYIRNVYEKIYENYV